MATLMDGQRTWSMTRDENGYRTYKLVLRVKADPLEGPANVLITPGLPLPGSLWVIDGDVDLWAWCRPEMTITPLVEDEPNRYWDVELTFSNTPPPNGRGRCHELQIEDPLLEPPIISGGFAKYQVEATRHASGAPIVYSNFEPVKGSAVEFDESRPVITIEQNVAALNLPLVASMMDSVNAYPLWGLPPRTIKLENFSWERRFYGSCYIYYNRVLEFSVKYDTFDRIIPDEGTKALNGHWDETTRNWVLDDIDGAPPVPGNPNHYKDLMDANGNPISMPLDGAGKPLDQTVAGKVVFVTGDVTVDRSITTLDPHGVTTGDSVAITNVEGATEVNGTWTVTVTGPTSFTLVGSANRVTLANAVPYVANTGSWHNLVMQGFVYVQKYPGTDFLFLGIPITF